MTYQCDQNVSTPPLLSHSRGNWPFWKTVPRYEPEYSASDLVRAIRTLLSPADPEELAGPFIGGAERLFLRSGRECLFAILQALKLRSRSRIGVPLYCCSCVFESIAAAGHVPVFLDLDLDTYSLDLDSLRRAKNRLDAIVIVHTFGYPADLAKIQTCLGSLKIPLVEDCAHGLFSEYEGGFLGTHTEASFFSFGLHKPAAVGGGGIALFNDTSLARIARKMAAPSPQNRAGDLGHALACLARGMAYRRAVYGALLASPFGRFRDPSLEPPPGNPVNAGLVQYSPTGMRRCDRVLLEWRRRDFADTLPVLSRNTRRLRAAIRGVPLATPEEPSYGKWNHFLLPVRYPDAKSQCAGRRYLMRRRIDTAPIFSGCARHARQLGYNGDCPNAEQAARTVCAVPHPSWLLHHEIEFIGESLRRSAEPGRSTEPQQD